jgi:SAM-dependent methyltransferase
MQPSLKKQLLADACEPYRAHGPSNYYWARGKLKHDPAFEGLIMNGLISDNAHVLDLGCGRGLLAAWLLAAERMHREGRWTGRIRPPTGLRFHGIELVGREPACGNQALQPIYGDDRVALFAGDMRAFEAPGADTVVILDVLHYVPYADQDRLLDRIRASLGSGGVFITRVGDARGGLRFRFSQLVDRCISFIQGHRLSRMWCRPLADWVHALERRGYVVQALPMSAGTPFANVMIVSRVP